MTKSSAGLALDRTGTRECYRGIGEFSMYVRRDWRGRGVGDLLVAALISEAERLGLWKLLSRIFPFNEASRALCRKHGFREVGVYEKHARLDGRWLDVVIVERLIAYECERRHFVTPKDFAASCSAMLAPTQVLSMLKSTPIILP